MDKNDREKAVQEVIAAVCLTLTLAMGFGVIIVELIATAKVV